MDCNCGLSRNCRHFIHLPTHVVGALRSVCPPVGMLSDRYAFRSVCTPVGMPSDWHALRSVCHPVGMHSGRHALRSVCPLVGMTSGRFAIRSVCPAGRHALRSSCGVRSVFLRLCECRNCEQMTRLNCQWDD